MESESSVLSSISPDILRLIFDQLAGDYAILCNVSLTCRLWRTLSWPSLLRIADLSSHNNGRQPQHECEVLPVIYADHHGKYREPNLVPRQRAFLRLMLENPGLAKYVRSLTWTLIWLDFDEEYLTPVDRQTWHVFSQLVNVTRLDLASLHDLSDEKYIRQNPARLFPAVTNLRLLGWMHRGLIKALMGSLNLHNLRALNLRYLVDEGAAPNGDTLDCCYVENYAPHICAYKHKWHEASAGSISPEVFERQEQGTAFIFPGPMWLPLQLVASGSPVSLTHLNVELSTFEHHHDLRSYYTLFQRTADVISAARKTLSSLVVCFGESSQFYEPRHTLCGTGRINTATVYRPWATRMAAAFLDHLLAALNTGDFPCLKHVDLKGFHVLRTAGSPTDEFLQLERILQAVRDCAFVHETFNETPYMDYLYAFTGYDNGITSEDTSADILSRS